MAPARRVCARSRAATIQGLWLSVVCSVPLGWSFVHSSFLEGDPTSVEECPSVAAFLAPNLQRSLDEKRTSGELSRSDRRALNLKVCDPSLQRLLRPLLGEVSDMAGLRDMAGAGPTDGGEKGTAPVLNALMTRAGALHD